MAFQFLFAFDRIKQFWRTHHPEWKDQEPFASVLKGDMSKGSAGGKPPSQRWSWPRTPVRRRGVLADSDGLDRNRAASETGHPTPRWSINRCLELVAYLRTNGFKTFIVSGGGIEFMRVWSERSTASRLSISSAATSGRNLNCGTAKPVLVRLPQINSSTTERASPSESTAYQSRPDCRVRQLRTATCKCSNGHDGGSGRRFCPPRPPYGRRP